jgi:hypothetical protein
MLLTHDLDEDHRRELLLVASANVDRLVDAIAWLEESFERMPEMTIRLPDISERENS